MGLLGQYIIIGASTSASGRRSRPDLRGTSGRHGMSCPGSWISSGPGPKPGSIVILARGLNSISACVYIVFCAAGTACFSVKSQCETHSRSGLAGIDQCVDEGSFSSALLRYYYGWLLGQRTGIHDFRSISESMCALQSCWRV